MCQEYGANKTGQPIYKWSFTIVLKTGLYLYEYIADTWSVEYWWRPVARFGQARGIRPLAKDYFPFFLSVKCDYTYDLSTLLVSMFVRFYTVGLLAMPLIVVLPVEWLAVLLFNSHTETVCFQVSSRSSSPVFLSL